jgi:hypothetical protein
VKDHQGGSLFNVPPQFAFVSGTQRNYFRNVAEDRTLGRQLVLFKIGNDDARAAHGR